MRSFRPPVLNGITLSKRRRTSEQEQQTDPLVPFCKIVGLGWALGTSSDSSLSKFISYTHLCLIALGKSWPVKHSRVCDAKGRLSRHGKLPHPIAR